MFSLKSLARLGGKTVNLSTRFLLSVMYFGNQGTLNKSSFFPLLLVSFIYEIQDFYLSEDLSSLSSHLSIKI